MEKYEEMLKTAYEKMPPIVFEKERFEVPQIQASVEGNKTIIKNFSEIAGYVRREENQILKFIGKDMGAAWRKDGSRVIFVGKFGALAINKKIEKYVKLYVVCPVCEKPDTELKRIDRVLVMKCSACGAVNPVPQL
jgi:translation initiation factor 2 subunit 2